MYSHPQSRRNATTSLVGAGGEPGSWDRYIRACRGDMLALANHFGGPLNYLYTSKQRSSGVSITAGVGPDSPGKRSLRALSEIPFLSFAFNVLTPRSARAESEHYGTNGRPPDGPMLKCRSLQVRGRRRLGFTVPMFPGSWNRAYHSRLMTGC